MEDRLFETEDTDDRKPWQRSSREIDEPAGYVGREHPDTAQAMQRKALPRSGTFRRDLYERLRTTPSTDDELEVHFGRSHQSTSGARSMLKSDGWVQDSGLRRVNRFGNDAIVWEVVP